MGGRTKPNWVLFKGGPFDGKRELLYRQTGAGVTRMHTPSAVPSMITPHEYMVTNDYERIMFVNRVRGNVRVAWFVRTLPDEPIPPPVKCDHYGSPIVSEGS